MESIGIKLKLLRVKSGLTQKEFAKLMNVRRETIGRWERESHVPNPICEDKLSKLLDEYEIFMGMSDKF
jgi:transcriptional regulator with XRE-family HTH domain